MAKNNNIVNKAAKPVKGSEKVIKDSAGKSKLVFDRINYILLIVGILVVILGFVLMTGPSSTDTAFEPDIFSVRRIRIAPVVCLIGFVSMIFSILYKTKEK